jgi:hypothetical protein
VELWEKGPEGRPSRAAKGMYPGRKENMFLCIRRKRG